MRRVQIEVVARAVEVDRQQDDRVEAVLLAIRLRTDEQCLLRDTVGRVGLLRVSIPEGLLTEWDWRELRIRADRPDHHDLLGRVDARLLEDVDAHHEVRVPIAAGIVAVGADATDLRCQVKDAVGLVLLEQVRDSVGVRQVAVLAAHDVDVMSVGFEEFHEMRAEEARAACHHRLHGSHRRGRGGGWRCYAKTRR